MGQKLKTEVHDAIHDALESGFGTIPASRQSTLPSPAAVKQRPVQRTPLRTLKPRVLENNVFEPPLCFQATASVDLLASNFNLVGSDNLDLERTYRGLLTMGAEVNTTSSTRRPSRATRPILSLTLPPIPPSLAWTKMDPWWFKLASPNFMAAEWSMDHLQAGDDDDDDLVQTVDLRMGHRNTTQSPTVYIEDGSKALDLNLVVDLSDENAATIDFAAGLYYLDAETLNSWGINMFDVASSTSIPVITSDGIRLAYHNDIVDLTQFTDQFPVGDIVESLGSTMAGVGDISMSDMQWVSVSDGTGIFDAEGGSITAIPPGAPNRWQPGKCSIIASRDQTPWTVQNPFTSKPQANPFPCVSSISSWSKTKKIQPLNGFLENIQSSDLERLMNSGFSLEAMIGGSFLNDIPLDGLPPAELTVEIILPNWVTTVDGVSTIVLTKTLEETSSLNLSLTGIDPYDWEHEIVNEEGRVLCYANQSTCVQSDVQFDLSKVNFNEWSASLSVTMALEAELSIYRLGFVDGKRCHVSEDIEACGQMEAFPSDLLRLVIDLSSRMEDPLGTEVDLPWCEDADLQAVFRRL